jgi:mRNA interferase RelE/StbE
VELPFSYHYKVEDDLKKLSEDQQRRIFEAIENRLGKAPEKYGDPLKETLADLWKLRVGDYRVVYEVNDDSSELIIWGIRHRKDIYKEIEKRKK